MNKIIFLFNYIFQYVYITVDKYDKKKREHSILQVALNLFRQIYFHLNLSTMHGSWIFLKVYINFYTLIFFVQFI